MQPRTLALVQAAGRIAVGTALTVQPQRAAGAWLGRDAARPSARVLSAAMGARDAALGAGLVHAARQGADLRPWLAAGVLADATDLAVTLRHRGDLPATAVAGVGLLAAGSAALGAWLGAQLG